MAVARKLKLLWQTPDSPLRDWILEVFSPLIEGEITDGKHQIFVDNCLVVDTHVHLADPAYYAQFRGTNAFLLREPDEFLWDLTSGVYINFCGVFRSQSSGAFVADRVFQIPVGYNRGMGATRMAKPASQRQFAWAMMGQLNKSTRPDCIRALLRVKPNSWYATDRWTPKSMQTANSAVENQPRNTYKELLMDAVFSPAPMGNVHQETTRPYEALESGSIPLLERNWRMDAHRRVLGTHPLPSFSRWELAAGFVESMWKDEKAMDQLQEECLTWWKTYKLTLVAEAEDFVDRLWMNFPQRNGEFVHGYARLPAWSAVELLRHHTIKAVGRRVVRQTRRFVEQGRFFERV